MSKRNHIVERASDVNGGQYIQTNPSYNSGYEDGKKAGKEYCASEIEALREQVEKLTKERDIKEHCITQFELEDLRMKEQLAALAEQNEKMREALTTCVCAMQDYQAGIGITEMFDRGERIGRNILLTSERPDLASPVLNRIKAEAYREAAELVEAHHTWITNVAAGKLLRAKADELDKL